MSDQCRIDVESMPSRPLRRGGRGGFEGGVRGACALINLSKFLETPQGPRGPSDFLTEDQKGPRTHVAGTVTLAFEVKNSLLEDARVR